MLDIFIIEYFGVAFYCTIQYITLCTHPGALVVFGGFDGATVSSTLETLNGTAWVTKQLQYPRFRHAMVLLPCP
jgi:hypothetical protein